MMYPHSVPNSSSHCKSKLSSTTEHTDSQDLALECPTTPLLLPVHKPFHVTPIKSSTQDKHEKALKRLTNMVQDLGQKLKKRDKQEQQLQEKAEKFNEVTLQLESAEERLVDAAAENLTLSRRIINMESAIDLESKGGPTTTSRNSVFDITSCVNSSEKRIDEAEFYQVKLERDSALVLASDMEMAVAESRSESDELRDQLVAITALLQQQKCGSSLVPVSESPLFVHLLQPVQGDVYACYIILL
jgi:DNA repair exonuclease SbcCD ATPase subunit